MIITTVMLWGPSEWGGTSPPSHAPTAFELKIGANSTKKTLRAWTGEFIIIIIIIISGQPPPSLWCIAQHGRKTWETWDVYKGGVSTPGGPRSCALDTRQPTARSHSVSTVGGG